MMKLAHQGAAIGLRHCEAFRNLSGDVDHQPVE
jgi:hypothetical protein